MNPKTFLCFLMVAMPLVYAADRKPKCKDADCGTKGGECIGKKDKCEGKIVSANCGKKCICCIVEINQCLAPSFQESVLWMKVDKTERSCLTAISEDKEELQIRLSSIEQKLDHIMEHCCGEANIKTSTTAPTTKTSKTAPATKTSKTEPTTTSHNGPRPTGTDDVIFRFINKCTQDLWMGADGRSDSKPSFVFNGLNFHAPNNGGWHLPAGATNQVSVPFDWFGARFWARTGCTGTPNVNFHCETGDCGPYIECATGNIPRGGAPPVTIAEMTLSGNGNNMDFFDISLVDGFNLPMTMRVHTYDESQVNPNEYWCRNPECLFDINSICPDELALTGSSGTVACYSACMKFNTDAYCCRNQYGLPSTCTADNWPVNYPQQVFKAHCPDAYSFAYDDETSTFTCRDTHYDIIFC